MNYYSQQSKDWNVLVDGARWKAHLISTLSEIKKSHCSTFLIRYNDIFFWSYSPQHHLSRGYFTATERSHKRGPKMLLPAPPQKKTCAHTHTHMQARKRAHAHTSCSTLTCILKFFSMLLEQQTGCKINLCYYKRN